MRCEEVLVREGEFGTVVEGGEVGAEEEAVDAGAG